MRENHDLQLLRRQQNAYREVNFIENETDCHFGRCAEMVGREYKQEKEGKEKGEKEEMIWRKRLT